MDAYWKTHRAFGNGGSVVVSTLIEPGAFAHELEVALLLAGRFGWRVELLPELVEDDPLRAIVLPDVRAAKNPDYRINGVYTDLKTPQEHSTYDYLRNRIKEALKQADIAVIELMDLPTLALMSVVANSKLNGERRLQKVIFISPSNEVFLFEKNQAGQ